MAVPCKPVRLFLDELKVYLGRHSLRWRPIAGVDDSGGGSAMQCVLPNLARPDAHVQQEIAKCTKAWWSICCTWKDGERGTLLRVSSTDWQRTVRWWSLQQDLVPPVDGSWLQEYLQTLRANPALWQPGTDAYKPAVLQHYVERFYTDVPWLSVRKECAAHGIEVNWQNKDGFYLILRHARDADAFFAQSK